MKEANVIFFRKQLTICLAMNSDERRDVVKILTIWYHVAEHHPVEEDEYLKEHPKFIPDKLAELLTQEERKSVLDQLIAHKEEHYPDGLPEERKEEKREEEKREYIKEQGKGKQVRPLS